MAFAEKPKTYAEEQEKYGETRRVPVGEELGGFLSKVGSAARSVAEEFSIPNQIENMAEFYSGRDEEGNPVPGWERALTLGDFALGGAVAAGARGAKKVAKGLHSPDVEKGAGEYNVFFDNPPPGMTPEKQKELWKEKVRNYDRLPVFEEAYGSLPSGLHKQMSAPMSWATFNGIEKFMDLVGLPKDAFGIGRTTQYLLGEVSRDKGFGTMFPNAKKSVVVTDKKNTALVHEWAHALDSMFGRKVYGQRSNVLLTNQTTEFRDDFGLFPNHDTLGSVLKNESTLSLVMQNPEKAKKTLLDLMNKSDAYGGVYTNSEGDPATVLAPMRKSLKKAFNDVMATIYTSPKYISGTLAHEIDTLGLNAKIQSATQLRDSELLARAMEAYVYIKNGGKDIPDISDYDSNIGWIIYPSGEEAERITKSLDNFFKELKTVKRIDQMGVYSEIFGIAPVPTSGAAKGFTEKPEESGSKPGDFKTEEEFRKFQYKGGA